MFVFWLSTVHPRGAPGVFGSDRFAVGFGDVHFFAGFGMPVDEAGEVDDGCAGISDLVGCDGEACEA